MSDANEIHGNGQVVRLPLWRSCFDDMIREGIEHGKTYGADYFEEKLREKRNTREFNIAVSKIRRALEGIGYFISGRGLNGNQFIVVIVENNFSVMTGYQRRGIDLFQRAVILGKNTRTHLLSVENKRRHNSLLQKLAMKSAFIKMEQSKLEKIWGIIFPEKPNQIDEGGAA